MAKIDAVEHGQMRLWDCFAGPLKSDLGDFSAIFSPGHKAHFGYFQNHQVVSKNVFSFETYNDLKIEKFSRVISRLFEESKS